MAGATPVSRGPLNRLLPHTPYGAGACWVSLFESETASTLSAKKRKDPGDPFGFPGEAHVEVSHPRAARGRSP